MKKIVLLSSLTVLALASSPADAVKKAVSKMIHPSVNVALEKYKELDDGWEAIRVKLSMDGRQLGEDLFFSNGKYVTPALLDTENDVDLKSDYERAAEVAKQAEIKTLLPDYIKSHKNTVKLGNKGGALTVVFSDPDCPFCRQHLKSMESILKTSDVLMVLMPLSTIHPQAANKASLLLSEIEKLGSSATTQQKLEIFNKYFADGEFPKADEKLVKELNEAANDAYKLGINYSPAIFDNVSL